MDEKTKKIMESHGWTPELFAMAESGLHPSDVDRLFLDRAQMALSVAGSSALEFLAANPGLSIIELAKRLNRGASAIGFIFACYKEAATRGVVRQTAKDLLIREILDKFPSGWSYSGDVSPLVKLGSWDDHVCKYGNDPGIDRYAGDIIRHLAIDHPPSEGWKPRSENDPVIDDLFDRYWPLEPRAV